MAPLALTPGEYRILDGEATAGCVVLPAADDGAEHLAVVLSGSGLQAAGGMSAAALISAGEGGPGAASTAAVRSTASVAATFHHALRVGEGAISSRVRGALTASRLADPPVEGEMRTFSVCAALTCESFVQVSATARWVGRRGAIYLDDTVPAGGLDQADIASLGTLFDTWLHPIDTLAFGSETDIDGNGVVVILLTDQVNALSGTCADGTVIQGYFYGVDLLPGSVGSNAGEVFYSRVPDPSVPGCGHTRNRVLSTLPPVFLHEFQHMINFGQKVLAQGGAPEHGWLNEGLSHFAEELGSRLIPGAGAQYAEADVYNAFDYLSSPASSYLVTPSSSAGSPAERGAQWLFLRWLADNHAATPVLGTDLTRALVSSTARGDAAVSMVTGEPFPELVGAWQLANYLDDLAGFSGPGALSYGSIDLRAVMRQLGPRYPLRPDSVMASGYARSVTLRAGSGQHVRLVQAAGAGRVSLRVTSPDGEALDPLLAARVALARLR